MSGGRLSADKLTGYSPLGRLKVADSELGQMLTTLKVLKPHAAHPSVAAAYQEAHRAVALGQRTAVSAALVDLADKRGVFDGAKGLPVFNHQPGGSW